ncbi:hypothetical protein [Cytobacillus gottheilii]|uniref:Uncharacterized protein n=2 Tax=Cytobacillus gottheilii TaxID=859144 RepID=A0ABX8FD68_9BACI|nr:hypothetical protein [Cytobacillus gottheilii]QVY62019.1 hypothetical protein J1899_02555 [Cytobacillus gottheilii]
MTKRTLLILSILYNLAIYGISLGGLYLEEQKEGKMTGDMFLLHVGVAFPFMIIGLIMIGTAVSPDAEGKKRVNRRSVIFGIVLGIGFISYRLGMSLIGE